MVRPVIVAVSIVCALAYLISSSSAEDQMQYKRGFRNTALSTARGFGKRNPGEPFQFLYDLGFQKPELSSGITAVWFAEQLARNPALAKYIVDKTVDLNGDGYISQEELYHVL